MTSTEAEGDQLASISNAVVQIYSECYGRGPTRAKSYAFDEHVLCVLEDFLTTVEQTLVENGQEQLVRAVRLKFQETQADRFKGAVTEITGRPVLSYHSQVTFHPPVGFEVFVLGDPAGDGQPEVA
jgi:uncharacterized protein YbcI